MGEMAATSELVTKPAAPKAGAIAMGNRGVELRTLDDAYRFAQAVVRSGLAPKGIDTPEKALIAMQYGAELGFTPMRSLSVITVVNGKPGIYGEAALAKISETGVCSLQPVMRHEGEGNERRAIMRFQRKNHPEPVEVSFSVADAKAAKLWGKAGPWTDYSDDMLGWRSVARMCKRYFGDVILGLVLVEELRDYPAAESRATPPAGPDPLLVAAVPLTATESVVVDTEVADDEREEESQQHPDDEKEATERAAAVEALITVLKSTNTTVGIERAWKNAKALRDAVDPDSLERLTLTYESRLTEIGSK